MTFHTFCQGTMTDRNYDFSCPIAQEGVSIDL